MNSSRFNKVSILLKFFFMVCIFQSLHAQTLIFKGKVENEAGEVVSFATVKVIGSATIIHTSQKGDFTLTGINKNSVLLIIALEYDSLLYTIRGNKDVAILRLKKSNKNLQEVEVVSTGYQDIPKERSTGSFNKIDNKTLNLQVGTNILNRLDGTASGLLFNIGKQNNNPQNNTNISIRGLSTINGPLDPLIVLDGFIYEGSITNINPINVENVTILKDAAAASIWGSRAGNGVIIITTKHGRFNQKLQLGINAGIILNSKLNLYALPVMSSADYINLEQSLFNQGYFDNDINSIYTALTPATEIFLKSRLGLISPSDSLAQINNLKQIDVRKQYQKYVYKKAVTQQYAINVNGGSESNAYVISLAYDKILGELRDNSRKINVSMQNIYRPIKNLQLTMQAYYTNEMGSSGMTGYNGLGINGRQYPYLQLADDAGNALAIPIYYRDAWTDTAGGGKLLNWKYFPLDDYKHSKTQTTHHELFANAGLKYKISRALDLDIRFQYQQQQNETEQLNDLESYYAKNIINLYSQIDPISGLVQNIVPMGGILNSGYSSTTSQTNRAQLNFNKAWKHHDVTAIFGGEIRQVENKSNSFTTYGYNDDPLSYTGVDYANLYPTFVTGNSAKIPSQPSFSRVINRFVSLYGNAAYTFMGRYIFSGSIRRDGSNLFGASTNDKWKPLWSVGTAWKISNEPFYTSSIIPVLKLRATYGVSGNVDLTKSAVAVGAYSGGNTINLPMVQINAINNPDLRWEKIGMLNIGVDIELKHRLLTGSIEYYHKKGTDLYGLSAYDYTAWGGSNELIRNAANMSGNGIDIILNSKNLDKVFKWNTSLLWNYNKSKTTKYQSETAQGLLSILGGGSYISPVIGKPLYAIAAYKWGGLDANGNPQGYVNGKLSTDYLAIQQEAGSNVNATNIRYIGSTSPTVFGSILNSFIFRQLTLSINLTYKLGYYFRKSVISYSQLISSGIGNSDYAKRWQKSGDELTTSVPSFNYPSDQNRDGFYAASEVNVLKADHLRLQFINLAYYLGNASGNGLLDRNHIQVYINAANLGVIWRANKEKLDPDYAPGLPPEKTIAIGIRANF